MPLDETRRRRRYYALVVNHVLLLSEQTDCEVKNTKDEIKRIRVKIEYQRRVFCIPKTWLAKKKKKRRACERIAFNNMLTGIKISGPINGKKR